MKRLTEGRQVFSHDVELFMFISLQRPSMRKF